MSSKFSEFTDKELLEELVRRFDHVDACFIKDIDDGVCISYEKYKGDLDPDVVYEYEGEEDSI